MKLPGYGNFPGQGYLPGSHTPHPWSDAEIDKFV